MDNEAVARGLVMWDNGATWVDVGGESTRPGAAPVDTETELRRVLPVIEGLRTARPNGLISIDTRHAVVAKAALAAGADMVNDVSGLRDPDMVNLVLETGCAVCIMHMQGEPDTMQTAPAYTDVMHDVSEFLSQRLADVSAVGIDLGRVIIDPGFGFGKTAEQNFELLARLRELCNQGQPVLVGLSRKSMISSVLDRPPEQRLVASVALALMAVERGARIVRVHDVAATFDALSMWQTIRHTLSQSQQP